MKPTLPVNVNGSTGALTFTVVFSNLSAPQSGAHIHVAARGANGPIIVNFGTPGGTSGTITGSGTITMAQLAQMRAHQTYVNVHSTALPGGEIRGQLGVARSIDYDGDGRQDHNITRAPVVAPPGVAQITFHNRLSFTGQHSATPFGDNNTDVAAPATMMGTAWATLPCSARWRRSDRRARFI